MESIVDQLFALRDANYADFTARLIPTVEPSRIIGVRAPQMRSLARRLRNTPEATIFLSALPHYYLEGNGLHAALICDIAQFEEALSSVDDFLPYVDNWATCDSLNPRAFARNVDILLPHVKRWMASSHEYTIRFGIGMLMRYFLDDPHFAAEHLHWVASITRNEYYISMMQAWYFATALAKQWDAALPYMQRGATDEQMRRRAIRKAIESFRLPDDHKATLRTLR